MPSRSIASTQDCQSLTYELMSPVARAERLRVQNSKNASFNQEIEKLSSLKNNVWNKIITSAEFENFNDRTYFRWLEIYKDKINTLNLVNPVSIEQKMAYIEVVNSRLLIKASSEIQKNSDFKLRKIQNQMQEFNLNSKLTPEELNSFATDLFLILKSPPSTLLDYFTKNKTIRMNEALMKTLQEDMLVIGLNGIIARVPEKDSTVRIEKSRALVQKLLQSKAWKFFVLPSDTAWVEKVKIPDELLQQIFIDGLEAHNSELITHLKNEGMIDHYERFRKVYKPIAFSIGFYFYYDKFSEHKSAESFQNLGLSLVGPGIATLNSQENQDQLKEIQFQVLIDNYKKTHKEGPSEKEYESFHMKVFGTPN